MFRTALLVALVLQATPAHQPALATHPPSCSIETGHKGSDAIITRTVRSYACEMTADGVRVPVSKAWFKAHCHRVDHLASGFAAQCDAYTMAYPLTDKSVARPAHGFGTAVQGVKDHALYVLIGAAVVACVASGGCGALGGS